MRIAFVPFCVESLSWNEIDRVFKAHGIAVPRDANPYSKTNLVDAYLTSLTSDGIGAQLFLAVANSVLALAKSKHGESDALATFAGVCRSQGLDFEDGKLVHAEVQPPAQTATRTRQAPVRPQVVRKILFLASNPTNSLRLRVDKEVRDLGEGLKRSKERDQFQVVPCTAVRVTDLRRGLLDHSLQIVHFSGHGTGKQGLVFEDESGRAVPVPTAALAELFRLCAGHIECVLLNACYSEVQATEIAKHVPYVVGMRSGISDGAALEFAVGFYDALGAGQTIESAFDFGRNAIALQNIPEHLTPVLLVREPSNFKCRLACGE